MMTDSTRYAFRADDGPIIDKAFGLIPFKTREEAEHTGSKFWTYSLEILRLDENGEWTSDD